MPIYKTPPFDPANAASKLPEPLRKPAGTAMAAMIDLVGGNDPQSIMPDPTGLAAGLMTRVPKSHGIRVLEDMKTLPSFTGFKPETVSAFQLLQQKYPRLFAHLSRVEPIPQEVIEKKGRKAPWGSQVTDPYVRGMSEIMINPHQPAGQQLNTAAHELTHAAQSLRDKHFNHKYAVSNLVTGYKDNPYEISARRNGQKFADFVENYKPKAPPVIPESTPHDQGLIGRLLGLIGQ